MPDANDPTVGIMRLVAEQEREAISGAHQGLSLMEAARSGADTIFVSCTDLRALDVIGGLETELSRPAPSSNRTLAWHMAQLSGAPFALAEWKLALSSL